MVHAKKARKAKEAPRPPGRRAARRGGAPAAPTSSRRGRAARTAARRARGVPPRDVVSYLKSSGADIDGTDWEATMPTKPDISGHLARELSVAQLNAIDLLVCGATDGEAAEAVGVSRQTVNTWRHHDPAFVAELNSRRLEIWG